MNLQSTKQHAVSVNNNVRLVLQHQFNVLPVKALDPHYQLATARKNVKPMHAML